jgi:hypothetical protein
MEDVLGLDMTALATTMDRLRVAVFVREVLKKMSDIGSTFDVASPVALGPIIEQATDRFQEHGWLVDDGEDFDDVVSCLRAQQVLTRTADGITISTRRLVNGTIDDDIEALTRDVDALFIQCNEEYDTSRDADGRVRQLDGRDFALQPRGSLTRGLARDERAAKARKRSASGSRAVGDLALFQTSSVANGGAEEPQLSGHAQEFVGWCAAAAGQMYNGVQLPDTKEVRPRDVCRPLKTSTELRTTLTSVDVWRPL